jgi:histidine ammonia-lyase
MGMTAARHARDIVANAEIVVAMEAMAAAQALDLRAPLEPAPATKAARDAIRAVVPYLEVDRELGPDIEACTALVRDGTLRAAVESVTAPVD